MQELIESFWRIYGIVLIAVGAIAAIKAIKFYILSRRLIFPPARRPYNFIIKRLLLDVLFFTCIGFGIYTNAESTASFFMTPIPYVLLAAIGGYWLVKRFVVDTHRWGAIRRWLARKG